MRDMKTLAVIAASLLAVIAASQTPPYLSARSSLYGVGGVSSQTNPSTGDPVSSSLTSFCSSSRSASSWGAASVRSEATSPADPMYTTQMFVVSIAQYWDRLTFSNPALEGQGGTVTYRVRVEGTAIAEGGVDPNRGRIGDTSNRVKIMLNYGPSADQTSIFNYEKYGDGTGAGADFTGQTLTITEPIQFGQPMDLRLHLTANATGWADMPGYVKAELGNVQFLGIDSVKNQGGNPVAYTLTTLAGQPWGTSVPAFSLTLNKATVAGQNYVQGTIGLTENAAQNVAFTTYDNSSLVTTPAQVTVPAGQSSKAFAIQVTAVNSPINTLIYAKRGVVTRSCPLTLTPLIPTALAFAPSVVTGGNDVSCRVVINGVAGPGGRTIAVFDNSPNTTMPSTVVVPAGASQVNFTISTTPVTSQKTVKVTARVSAGEKTGTFRINP